MVGRRPSVAPILLTPVKEDKSLVENEFANNHTMFVEDSRAIKLRPELVESQDQLPQQRGSQATLCPLLRISKDEPP